jgi:hypothetical protein
MNPKELLAKETRSMSITIKKGDLDDNESDDSEGSGEEDQDDPSEDDDSEDDRKKSFNDNGRGKDSKVRLLDATDLA